MVQDLKTTGNSNKGDKTIDLTALGKAKNTSIGGGEKPAIIKPIPAVVKGIEIKMEEDKYEHNKDDPNVIYHPGYLIVTTEFEHPETGERVTSKDFFRGLRFYLALDETLSPMRDETGEEVISRYWIGDRSGLGQILKVVREHDSDINDYVDFFAYLQPGLEVMIKSQFNTNPNTNQQTIKQQIVGIRE